MKHLNQINSDIITDSQMRWYNIAFIIYCMIMFLALDLSGQDMTAKFDSIVSEVVEDPNGPGYSILIRKNGKTLYRKSIGFADLKNEIRIKSNHVFQIGSITKQFTALGILRLVDKGILSLDDDIRKYIPSISASESIIKIHHLLAHTSGIVNHSSIPNFDTRFSNDNTITPIQIINEFNGEEVEFLPGEKASYNNFGYVILGHIIEEVSQLSYSEFLNQEFFIPLNLTNTSYQFKNGESDNVVKAYKKINQEFSNIETLNLQLAFSAGGITSTVEDVAKWYEYVNSLKLSNDEIIRLALTPITTKQNLTTGYGYGWQLGTYRGRNYYGHDGIIKGFNCDTRFFEEDQIFIAVFSNMDGNGSTRLLRKLSDVLMHTHIGAELSNEITSHSLEKFNGRYQLRPDFIIEISHDDQKIFGSPNGQGSVELKPIGDNKFYVREIEAEIEFKQDHKGVYNSFTLVQGGQENIALRVEP